VLGWDVVGDMELLANEPFLGCGRLLRGIIEPGRPADGSGRLRRRWQGVLAMGISLVV